MTLKELAAGKLVLKDYTYESGRLDLALDLAGHGAIAVNLPTDTLRVYGTGAKVKLFLIELGETLLAENGHYAPPPDDGRRMRELQSGAGLSYGRSVTDVKWALSFKGENAVLLACLISDLAAARIESGEA